MWILSNRPALDAREIDRMSPCNLESLFETLPIRVVEVPSEPIHDALGGMQDSEHAPPIAQLCKVVDDLFANRDRTRRKLHPIWSARMHPMALLSLEAQGFHRVINSSGETDGDEVEVIGFVFVLGINRDCGAAGKDDRDTVRFESGAHERGDLFQG